MTVSGRGELHLAVLIEAMRREDYEFSVSTPRVIIKEENGVEQNRLKESILKCHKNIQEQSLKSSREEGEKCSSRHR